jgi:dipeptidase E
MAQIRILALSSSRAGNSGYLETAAPLIKDFIGTKPGNIAFIPFASVTNEFEEYASRVNEALTGIPQTIQAVLPENARSVIEESDIIMTGGGNTFKLLHDIYKYNLMETIRLKVLAGTPYIGWSAGTNITGPTIGTTNDMPIVEPESFRALNFFPFQINPHYISLKPEGFNGETRDQRLEEFLQMNPGRNIIGLPEGTALRLEAGTLNFTGPEPGVLFQTEGNRGTSRREIKQGTDLSFLL